MTDKSHWSTRYYQVECTDIIMTLKTDGPDDRADPSDEFTMACLTKSHDPHPVTRISPDYYEELTTEDDTDLEVPDDEYSDAEFIDRLVEEGSKDGH